MLCRGCIGESAPSQSTYTRHTEDVTEAEAQEKMSAQFDSFLVEFQDTIQSYMVRVALYCRCWPRSRSWLGCLRERVMSCLVCVHSRSGPVQVLIYFGHFHAEGPDTVVLDKAMAALKEFYDATEDNEGKDELFSTDSHTLTQTHARIRHPMQQSQLAVCCSP